MLTLLLGVIVGYTIAKMPPELWAQAREEVVVGVRTGWAWLRAKFGKRQ